LVCLMLDAYLSMILITAILILEPRLSTFTATPIHWTITY